MGSTAALLLSGIGHTQQGEFLAVQAIQYSLQALAQGEIGLEGFVRFLDKIVNGLLPPYGADRLMNDAIRRGCRVKPVQRRRGNPGEPTWLRGLAADMARYLNRVEGLSLNREAANGKPWAFAEVAARLSGAGVPMTPSQVEKFYSKGFTLESSSEKLPPA